MMNPYTYLTFDGIQVDLSPWIDEPPEGVTGIEHVARLAREFQRRHDLKRNLLGFRASGYREAEILEIVRSVLSGVPIRVQDIDPSIVIGVKR